jgi:hypothetical protein
MPNPFEAIPPTLEHKHFPIGDIASYEEQKAHSILEQLSAEDTEEQKQNFRKIRGQEVTHWRSFSGQDKIWNDVKDLAESWGNTRLPDAEDRASLKFMLGFQNSLSFIKNSNLLPVIYINFSDELHAMGSYNADVQELFTNEVWACMQQSHPRLYNVMAQLSKLTTESLEYEDKDELILLDAGLALPYVMASSTRMIRYMHHDLDHKFYSL